MARNAVIALMVFISLGSAQAAEAPGIITTVEELILALQQFSPDVPAAVAIGRGYKAAPIRVECRLMTPDQRSFWWDNHKDLLPAEAEGSLGTDGDGMATATPVLVLRETTRAEPPMTKDELASLELCLR